MSGSRPMVRWWWFESRMVPEHLTAELEWMAARGFGGAEVAFWKHGGVEDPAAPEFLSEQWSAACLHARREALRLGLDLDFTFGTQWPFGGTWVREADAVQTWSGPSRYRLRVWWKQPEGDLPPRVVNHLDREALIRYAGPLGEALRPALGEGPPAALFCDSWELPSNPPLWTEGIAEVFAEEFGYDLKHLMNYLEYHSHARYDYRKLLSRYVIEEFFQPFTAICHELGAVSRVQCHGAPCDLLAAYAAVDIPETETLLFDPHFASFAASAAAIRGRVQVSCESFTALYGLSRAAPPGYGREQAADIKLVADAMFAHGVNRIVWHGMAHNAPGEDVNRFGATCAVGPLTPLAGELPGLNAYLATISEAMSAGRPMAGVGVYLPLEDQWMRHLLPGDQMRPSAHYHWELQHVRFPEAWRGWQPLWISMTLLPECRVIDGQICCGDMSVRALIVDCEWLDRGALREMLRLANEGARIVLKQNPAEPGYVRHDDFPDMLNALHACPGVGGDLPAEIEPLVRGEAMPAFRIREDQNGFTVFFAHPASQDVRYPLVYGQSAAASAQQRQVELNLRGRRIMRDLHFGRCESLLFRIRRDGGVEPVPLAYQPPDPVAGDAFPRDHRYPGYVVDHGAVPYRSQ